MISSWLWFEYRCSVSQESPILSRFYKIIYWDAEDKLKKGEVMFTVKIRIT